MGAYNNNSVFNFKQEVLLVIQEIDFVMALWK